MVKNYLISMFMFTTTFKGCYIRSGKTVYDAFGRVSKDQGGRFF